MSNDDKQRVIALRQLANNANTSPAAKAQLLERAKQIESGAQKAQMSLFDGNTTGAHMKTNKKKTSPKKATSKKAAAKASPKKATAAAKKPAKAAAKAKDSIKKAEKSARKETVKAAEKLQVAKVELAKAATLPKGSAAKKAATKKAKTAKKSAVKSAKKAVKAMATVTETVASVPTAAKTSPKKASAKKSSAKKSSAKKSSAKKSSAKKASAKKASAKKATAKKATAKKATAKKATAKKATAKKATAKKATAKKATAKKASAKKATAKKATAKKTSAKKATAKKASAKKATAKKATAKAKTATKKSGKKKTSKKSKAKKAHAKTAAPTAHATSATKKSGKKTSKKSGKKKSSKKVHRHTTTAIELHGRKTPESVKRSIAGAKKTRSVQTYEKDNKTIRVDHRIANPLTNAEGGLDAKKIGIVTFGVLLGYGSADVVDRVVATAARGEAKYPWFSRDAAVRIMQRPDAMRLLAQGAVALAYVAGSMAAKDKMPQLAMLFASGAVGAVVHGAGQAVIGWVVPKILSVKMGNERSIANRLYPMEQDAMQAPAAADIAAENAAAKDAPGQQDGATPGTLPDSYLFAPAPASAALPSGTPTSTTTTTKPAGTDRPAGVSGTPTVYRPVQGTPRSAGAFVGEPVAGPRVTPGIVGAPKIRPVDGSKDAWEFGMRPAKGAGTPDTGACDGSECEGGGCSGGCGGKCSGCAESKDQDGLDVRVPNRPKRAAPPPVRVSNLPPPSVAMPPRDGGGGDGAAPPRAGFPEVPYRRTPAVAPDRPTPSAGESATIMRPGATPAPELDLTSASRYARGLRGTPNRRGFDGLSSGGSDNFQTNFRTNFGHS